jgi:hypothetical protein
LCCDFTTSCVAAVNVVQAGTTAGVVEVDARGLVWSEVGGDLGWLWHKVMFNCRIDFKTLSPLLRCREASDWVVRRAVDGRRFFSKSEAQRKIGSRMQIL